MVYPLQHGFLLNYGKPVYGTLRNDGHISCGYIDDTFLMSYSFDRCTSNVHDTVVCSL